MGKCGPRLHREMLGAQQFLQLASPSPFLQKNAWRGKIAPRRFARQQKSCCSSASPTPASPKSRPMHQQTQNEITAYASANSESSVRTSRELASLSYHSLPRISNSRRWGKNLVIFSNCSSEERPMEEIWRERIEGNVHDGVESPSGFEFKKRVWRDSIDPRLAIWLQELIWFEERSRV